MKGRLRGVWRPALVLAVLALAFVGGVAVAQDAVVPGGPVGGMAQLWRDFGTFYAPVVSLAPFDGETGGAVVMDVVHHEVHEGETFQAESTFYAVADATNRDMLLRVGGSVDAHATMEIIAGGQVTVTVYESPTVGANGTALAALNLNRTSTNTADSLIYHTPLTVTLTGGTELVPARLIPGGTSVQTRIGGSVRANTEWILAPGKAYLIRARNNSGGAITLNMIVQWYEEEE